MLIHRGHIKERMPGELNKVRDNSYSKGKGKGFWTMLIPGKSGHKRGPTQAILLKIRVNDRILMLIEDHPLEKPV